MPSRLDRLLTTLSCDLWPAGIGEPDGFLQALAARHPDHSVGLLTLAAIAMGSTARQLRALRSAAPGQEAAAPDAAGLALLANSWETAVSLLCAPALDNAWRLAGRRLAVVLGAPPPQLTPGEQPWVELSKALHSSLLSSLAACGTALGLNQPLLAAMGGVTSPLDVAMWLAHLLRQLLDSGTSGSAVSEPGAAGGGSAGDSRQGAAGGRPGGAAAPSLSASERPQWTMRLTAMLGDALHLCIRLSWPVQGCKPAGSTGATSGSSGAATAAGSSGGNSGGGGGGSGSRDVVAAARGSTAAPPVELATVKQLLQLLADAVASQYRAALEQQHTYITFRSIAADSAGHAAAGEDGQHPESDGAGGSGGSTARSGSRDGQASAGPGSRDGDGGGDEEDEGEEEEEEEEEEDATCAARQHALWTLCVLLQALALRLPAADAAAWAHSLAASMCQIIEAATRSSAAAFQAAAAAFAEDSAAAGSDAAGTAQAGAAEQPSAASEPAGTAGTAGTGAQQAASTAQQGGAAGAVPEAGGPGDSAAAAAARPDSEVVTDEEGRDLVGCAQALTWLMARLQESASEGGASLTPLQHRDALHTLLRLLRSAAKHALAAADAVVAMCPAQPASGATSVEGLPSWLHNSVHLLAWAACAVAQRAGVWREALLKAGVVDEQTE